MKRTIPYLTTLMLLSCQSSKEPQEEPTLYEKHKEVIELFQSQQPHHPYIILEENNQTDIYYLNTEAQEVTNMTKTDSICEHTITFQDQYIAYFADSDARQDLHVYNTITKEGKNLTRCNPHVMKSSKTFKPQTYIKFKIDNRTIRTNNFNIPNYTYKK